MDENTNTEDSPSLEFETDVFYTGGMRFVKDEVTGPLAFYGKVLHGFSYETTYSMTHINVFIVWFW